MAALLAGLSACGTVTEDSNSTPMAAGAGGEPGTGGVAKGGAPPGGAGGEPGAGGVATGGAPPGGAGGEPGTGGVAKGGAPPGGAAGKPGTGGVAKGGAPPGGAGGLTAGAGAGGVEAGGASGGGCSSPVVTSVTPTAVTAGTRRQFTVAGDCLPGATTLNLPGCVDTTLVSASATEVVFECGVQTSRALVGEVLDAPGGSVLSNVNVTATWGTSQCPSSEHMCAGTCENFHASIAACGRCFAPCQPGETCEAGICMTETPIYGVPGPSCNGMTGTECQGESCCANILVPGGSYNRDGNASYPATVSDFYLDKYEVTVGRFREFVNVYDGTPPAAGAGAHPLIAGTGWQSAWDTSLPADQATLISNLKCYSSFETWTDTASANEAKAINCVNWYEAMAFCAWDGGRLPTEAEWEYAAGGGDENRLYPWGSTTPDCTLVNFMSCSPIAVDPVGDYAGAGRWGHGDLAGNVWEWNFDWRAPYPTSCNNCVNTTEGSRRVLRGGYFNTDATHLRAAYRSYANTPAIRDTGIGLRCARSAP